MISAASTIQKVQKDTAYELSEAIRSKLTCYSTKGSSIDFLSLPPEIRNHIYREVFTIDGPVALSTERQTSTRMRSTIKDTLCGKSESALSLLLANHQIH